MAAIDGQAWDSLLFREKFSELGDKPLFASHAELAEHITLGSRDLRNPGAEIKKSSIKQHIDHIARLNGGGTHGHLKEILSQSRNAIIKRLENHPELCKAVLPRYDQVIKTDPKSVITGNQDAVDEGMIAKVFLTSGAGISDEFLNGLPSHEETPVVMKWLGATRELLDAGIDPKELEDLVETLRTHPDKRRAIVISMEKLLRARPA